GSSTSKRRHLLLISRLALNRERNVLIGERLQRSLRNQVLAGLEHPAGKTAKKEGQGSLLCLTIGKSHGDHRVCPVASGSHLDHTSESLSGSIPTPCTLPYKRQDKPEARTKDSVILRSRFRLVLHS